MSGEAREYTLSNTGISAPEPTGGAEYALSNTGMALPPPFGSYEYALSNTGMAAAKSPGYEYCMVGDTEVESPKYIQVWGGSGWVAAPLRYWNGKGWVTARPLLYRAPGDVWIELNDEGS